MKKTLIISLFVSALSTAASAQVKVGVKGGFNVTDMSFSEKVFDTSNRLGYFIGPSVQIALPLSGLGVDISGFYEHKESKLNDETIKHDNIVVPANLRLSLGLSETAGIYLAAGPQFAFNVGDDKFTWKSVTGDSESAGKEVENTFRLKKSFLSVNLGAGVYLSKHFEVGFTYNIGVSKTGDASWVDFRDAATKSIDDDTKAKTWTVSAAYYF
jgi:opacity protein-like surface antigen